MMIRLHVLFTLILPIINEKESEEMSMQLNKNLYILWPYVPYIHMHIYINFVDDEYILSLLNSNVCM